MPLREQFEKEGNWLFRWRSYFPLLFTGFLLISLRNFQYPGQSHLLDHMWEIVCMIISFFGLGIRIYTVGHTPKGTSGRNTRRQKASVLNTTGIYSVVRHPLYLGNFFCGLGFSMFPRVWWLSVIYVLAFWIYYERIMFAEEEFLRRKFGRQYESWAERTPAFCPRFSNWTPPSLPFSLKNVLKREYTGLFVIISSFTFLEIVGDIAAEGEFELDPMWLALFLTGSISYLVLRTLKKRTNVLCVDGR